jgi:hypothetical protein
MLSRTSFLFALSVLFTPTFGCLGTEPEKQAQAEQLAACREGASDEELQDNILITQEYASSLASSLQLTWLPTLFAVDFLLLYGQTITGVVSGSPVDWSFDAGVYRHGGATAAIELRVLLTEDSGYGPAGTPVTEDIFSLDSYLEGAIVAPNDDGSVTIDYAEPGPLVELLGLGADPPNPLTVTAAERETILDHLSTLALAPDYVAYGHTPLLKWDMHWASPPETIGSIAHGDVPIDIELVAVNATRDDLGQTLTTDVWDVSQQTGDVGGHTTFTVTGGSFPYRGRIDFTSTPFAIVLAERSLDCL